MSSESSAYYDRATIAQSSCKDGAVVSGQTTHIHGARILLRNSHLPLHRLAQSPTRSRLALMAGVALGCTLFAGSIYAAAQAQRSPQTAQREQLTIAPAEAMKPWTGDLD